MRHWIGVGRNDGAGMFWRDEIFSVSNEQKASIIVGGGSDLKVDRDLL